MSYYKRRAVGDATKVSCDYTHVPIPEADIAERGGCYVEIVFSVHTMPSRTVIRIMRPTKPVTSFPGFVHMFDGWYQWTIDGDEKKRLEEVKRFLKRYSSKVSIYLKANWEVISEVVLKTHA